MRMRSKRYRMRSKSARYQAGYFTVAEGTMAFQLCDLKNPEFLLVKKQKQTICTHMYSVVCIILCESFFVLVLNVASLYKIF